MTDKLKIEIDGHTYQADAGEMIIAVADREGIAIPRFCYHKKLSIAANCRMCLVEVEQGGRPLPKPVPACATPVVDGMRVWTRSPKALEAQRGTMEFLLINHPLDCPICDQGGECELQDVAMGYGSGFSRFSEGKRVVQDEDLGPLIATDMTRCIHCTRCVRFCAEITGVRELGATGRGEEMRIGTFIGQLLTHELSGNVIDLCPVGALTSKPYRFTARAWELTAHEGIAPHDGLGSNISLHVRRGQVMRVHPRENEAINETWISDRDRFSYEGLNSPDRLTRPWIKRAGNWQEAEWPEVLSWVAERLKAADPAQLGWLLAPNATLEELYLAARIMRGLGSSNIDHRLRQQDFRADAADPLFPWLGLPILELSQQRAILLIGTHIRHEQPLLAHRIRQAALRDAEVICINPLRLELHHPARQLVGTPAQMLRDLAAVAQALEVRSSGILGDLIGAAEPTEVHRALAQSLRQAGGEGCVLLGALAQAHPDYSLLRALADLIAEGAGGRLGYLPAAANSLGAHLAGAHPAIQPGAHPDPNPGLAVGAMLAQPMQTLVLWGIEPDLDLIDPQGACRACEQAEWVIACASFASPALYELADVLLPIAAFAETSGTFVNASATWQSFAGAVSPPGEARPGWKVLRVLGNLLDLPGFAYQDSAEIREELAALCATAVPANRPRQVQWAQGPWIAEDTPLVRIAHVPIYRLDPLVRRARALSQMPGSEWIVRLHPDQAAQFGLSEGDWVRIRQGEGEAEAPLLLDPGVPMGAAWIPAAVAGSERLGTMIGPVELELYSV